MSEGCSFRVAFSPTATLASIHRQPAKTCFFHLCTAVMVPKFEPCYPLKSWRAGTFKEPMVVEAEADTSRYAEEVDEFPYSQMKQEGEMEEEKVEALDSQEDCFRRKKKKTDGLKVINYDRFKMNNGREVYEEKAYLVGVESKGTEADNIRFEESLKELAQLADTAGLLVVGSTYQKLSDPNPRTYIGSGKVTEIKNAVRALGVETVIFDDELSAGQLRNLEKAFGGDIRVCDRTSLILDIFNQRAATHEAALQVSLAQMEYQLPRLTKMWSHLERQAGGKVKGMGEKQIEVDKRILRTKIGALRKELESVRKHRKLYRNRRLSVPIPVVSLVGYTNAGKSTLLNRLTGANVLAEDCLFATLDPTTRKVQMNNGRPFLLTDTVGFIQKLPTTLEQFSLNRCRASTESLYTLHQTLLKHHSSSARGIAPYGDGVFVMRQQRMNGPHTVAAFRATLEEISESSLLVHVVDISHRLAQKQADVVEKVLQELDAALIPKLIVWNKIDQAINPSKIRCQAEKKGIICISAFYGDGLEEFCNAVQTKLRDSMVSVDAFVPYGEEDLLSTIRHVGIIEETEYLENGTRVRAHVPLPLSRSLTPVRQYVASSTLL